MKRPDGAHMSPVPMSEPGLGSDIPVLGNVTDTDQKTVWNRGTIRSVKMRSVLIGFTLLIVLPVWLFAILVSFRFANLERQGLENAARLTAKSMAEAVDFRLSSLETAITALALSSSLRAGDLEGFYREAQAVARTQRAVIGLSTADGQQLINTNAPFGQSLPPTLPEARVERSAATRSTQVSPAFFGNVTSRWLVSIAVPVPVPGDGPVAQVVIIGLDTALLLGEVLGISDIPAGWALALVDDNNIIMARRPHLENVVGMKANESTLRVVGPEKAGSGLAATIDNRSVQTYFQRTERANWVVLVGIPEDDFDQAVRRSVLPVLATGVLVLALSLLLAALMGRRFSEHIGRISGAALAYRERRLVPTTGHSHIAELHELQSALDSASSERASHERAQEQLLAEKDLLMQEVHHRVKNSLQLVRGVLRLQGRQASHPEAKAALEQAAARIMTVADVHQHLYQGLSTAEAHLARYLSDLVADLASSMLPADSGRRIKVMAPDIVWPSEKLTAIGLLVAELVTNAVKYGAGDIEVDLKREGSGAMTLSVTDEGPGFPDDFAFDSGSGLGSRVIVSLVQAPEGEVAIDRSASGARVVVTFNASWRSQERA